MNDATFNANLDQWDQVDDLGECNNCSYGFIEISGYCVNCADNVGSWYCPQGCSASTIIINIISILGLLAMMLSAI